MDRDEFMELVYETFADEPDNVLANGIIEAADAYVEHEKAQLYKEGTTSDLISKTETVEHLRRMLEATVPNTDYDEGFVDGVEFGVSTVSTMPTIQPVATDTNVGNNSEIPNSSDAISRQWLLDCINDGWIKFDTDKDANRFIHLVRDIAPTIQPEPQEGHWIKHETPDGGEQYECSECGVLWEFTDGTPEDNEAYFCPKCGKKLITK